MEKGLLPHRQQRQTRARGEQPYNRTSSFHGRQIPLQEQVNVHESLHSSRRLHQALRGLRSGLHHRVEMLSSSHLQCSDPELTRGRTGRASKDTWHLAWSFRGWLQSQISSPSRKVLKELGMTIALSRSQELPGSPLPLVPR